MNKFDELYESIIEEEVTVPKPNLWNTVDILKGKFGKMYDGAMYKLNTSGIKSFSLESPTVGKLKIVDIRANDLDFKKHGSFSNPNPAKADSFFVVFQDKDGNKYPVDVDFHYGDRESKVIEPSPGSKGRPTSELHYKVGILDERTDTFDLILDVLKKYSDVVIDGIDKTYNHWTTKKSGPKDFYIIHTLRLPSQNLKTGKNKYFNIFSPEFEDAYWYVGEGFGKVLMMDNSGSPLKVGDKFHAVQNDRPTKRYDNTNADLEEGDPMVITAVLTQEDLMKKGDKINSFYTLSIKGIEKAK